MRHSKHIKVFQGQRKKQATTSGKGCSLGAGPQEQVPEVDCCQEEG